MELAQSSKGFFLQDIALFSGLSAEDFNAFVKAAYARAYRKGEHIYHQGDPADRFFIIASGWVRLYRETIDGDESVSSILTKGDVFGEGIIFYQNNHYIFSAQAVEQAFIFEISKTILRQRADENPDILQRVMTSMCEKMIKLQAENERLAHMTATQRVACLLLRLAAHMVGNGGTFTLPYDKSLAAAQLGMKRETFSRALAQLKKLGVTINGSEVKVESFRKLTEYSCKHCAMAPGQCAGARFNKCKKYSFSDWSTTHSHNSHDA